MTHLRRLIAMTTVGLVLAACSPQAGTSSASAASASPSSSMPSSTTPVGASATPDAGESPAAEPTAVAGDFTCDLPIVEQATVPRANIVDVRVGEHAGYDRVVFEFTGGTPEISLDRAEPPFTQDASGLPLEVPGESWLRLTMRGGTKQTDSGESSYDGPREFHPEYTQLQSLVEGGDFEGQSTWYIGLATEGCVHVDLLEDAPRLVIDIQH